jgi:hypothetical protein
MDKSEADTNTFLAQEIEEWWLKHPLCREFGLTTQNAYLIGLSATQASIKAIFGKLFKDSSKFYTDLFIARFLKDDNRSTGQRFGELGLMLTEAESRGVKIIPAEKLIKKIINHTQNNPPQPMAIDKIDAWLCDHWVSGEILCMRSYPEVSDLMKVYGIQSNYDPQNVAQRIKRLGLKKPSRR